MTKIISWLGVIRSCIRGSQHLGSLRTTGLYLLINAKFFWEEGAHLEGLFSENRLSHCYHGKLEEQTKEQHLIAMALLRRANSRKHFYHRKDSNEEIMAVMQEELSYYKVTLFKSEIPILSFLWSPLRPNSPPMP